MVRIRRIHHDAADEPIRLQWRVDAREHGGVERSRWHHRALSGHEELLVAFRDQHPLLNQLLARAYHDVGRANRVGQGVHLPGERRHLSGLFVDHSLQCEPLGFRGLVHRRQVLLVLQRSGGERRVLRGDFETQTGDPAACAA